MNGLHVAIIMDGNGRWARAKGLPRWKGHLEGLETVRNVVRAAPGLGVGTLTLFAFSSDNWRRPATEVGRIFWMLRHYAKNERDELVANGVRLTMMGRRDRLPRSALREAQLTEAATRDCKGLHLRLAVDYSARTAILSGVRELLHRAAPINVGELDLRIRGATPPPDLIVRTAGERRLSDFLLWEAAYSELYFTEKQWPEFSCADFEHAIADFTGRERRFGGPGKTHTGERRVG